MKKTISVLYLMFFCVLLFSNERIIPFSQNGKIPYRKSGNGGYLNNFPLKIYDNKTIFNELEVF